MGSQLIRRSARAVVAFGGVLALVAVSANLPMAQAITPPSVDPALAPGDGTPGPDQPMRRSNSCSTPITVNNPDVTLLAPGFDLLSISAAWQYSTGNGVPVAVIDTGVTPNPRLPVVAGGDYIMGGDAGLDGLQDCDAHGTIIASIIAGAPQGILPMPRPMPAVPAFPAPAGPPPVTGAPLPPTDIPGPLPPPPPPAPVTITKTAPPPPPAPAPPPPPPPPGGDDAGVAPQNGPPDPQTDDEPAVPAPPPGAPDGVAGVAPHATVISIRQSSRAFEPVNPGPADANSEEHQKAGTLATLAKAVVHAADLGAKVINISVTACVPAADTLDQRTLGAALWYAATVKDAVIVAAAGNVGESGCDNNPMYDPLNPSDPRDWNQVKVVSSPSWFSDYVLSVGGVDATGAPIDKSMSGPWVAVAAPATHIMGLSPQGGGPVNAYPPSRPGEKNMPFWGTSFSAAYVSGLAALVRAKYPTLSAHQIINRIVQTAHNPPGGVDNKVGYGMVDPVAALTFNIPAGERIPPGSQARVITPAPPPPAPDHRARNVAAGFIGALALMVLAVAVAARIRRAAR
ncbi:MAG: type VII secretion-associated serine protease mycosin [Mycolicibacterium sp.]|uniref:type VII secretion-associated serine protease mycosin n=1 Tax=Mycolicibacterium sp. TaxID=2320850 RepID=UPI003D116232